MFLTGFMRSIIYPTACMDTNISVNNHKNTSRSTTNVTRDVRNITSEIKSTSQNQKTSPNPEAVEVSCVVMLNCVD